MLLGLVTAAVALVIDQASKYWILHDVLEDKAMIIFTPFFSLVRAWNTGVSFSMFNDWGLSGVIVLSLVAFVIIAFLVNWLRKEPSKLIQVSLGLIIGGALAMLSTVSVWARCLIFLISVSAPITGLPLTRQTVLFVSGR